MPNLREILFTWLLGAAAVSLTIFIVNQFFALNDTGRQNPPKSIAGTRTEASATDLTVAIEGMKQRNQELEAQIKSLHKKLSELGEDGGSSDRPRKGPQADPARPDSGSGATQMESDRREGDTDEIATEQRFSVIRTRLSNGSIDQQVSSAVSICRDYVARGEFERTEHFILLAKLKQLYAIRGLRSDQNASLVDSIKLLNDLFVAHVETVFQRSPDEAQLLVWAAEREVKLRDKPGPLDSANANTLKELGLLR